VNIFHSDFANANARQKYLSDVILSSNLIPLMMMMMMMFT
jgi:hypothetical protein